MLNMIQITLKKHIRWNIEINFKLLKANLNLDNFKTKKQDKINKELKSIDIVNFLFNYILKIYNKETKNNKQRIIY